MAKLIVPIFLSFFFLAGCGSTLTPSTVHASAPQINSLGPESLNCGPADQGTACTFNHNVYDAKGNFLFYCQGETHVFDATHTASFHLEIGVSSLIADPNLSGCAVPMPERSGWLNMKGTLSLVPWTGNPTSIATFVYAVDNGQKAALYPGKIAATKGISVAVPMEGTSGEPLTFSATHYADSFLVWFNVDLPQSIPATISVSGAADIQ